MRKIRKFDLNLGTGITIIELPSTARILKISLQSRKPVIWFMVNTELKVERRIFQTVRTDHDLSDGFYYLPYIGSYQVYSDQGEFVGHVFEDQA